MQGTGKRRREEKRTRTRSWTSCSRAVAWRDISSRSWRRVVNVRGCSSPGRDCPADADWAGTMRVACPAPRPAGRDERFSARRSRCPRGLGRAGGVRRRRRPSSGRMSNGDVDNSRAHTWPRCHATPGAPAPPARVRGEDRGPRLGRRRAGRRNGPHGLDRGASARLRATGPEPSGAGTDRGPGPGHATDAALGTVRPRGRGRGRATATKRRREGLRRVPGDASRPARGLTPKFEARGRIHDRMHRPVRLRARAPPAAPRNGPRR